jgi:hypothetical protein
MGRMSFTREPRARGDIDPAKGVSSTGLPPRAEPPVAAGTIHSMQKDRRATEHDAAQPPALPKDQSRLEMMAREKRMTLEQRLELFERLSRDAAWIRSAKRVR